MPTYDYVCDACNHEFELFQSITEEKKKKCPKCGKNKLRRLFGTGAAILFKGSGFYQTDYRSESYKSGEKKESEAAKPPTTESTPASSTDTAKTAKPAKASDAKK